MRRDLTTLEKSDILNRYRDGETITSIAKLHGIMPSTVSQMARRNGLPMRQQHKLRTTVDCTACATRNPVRANYCMQCGKLLLGV